MEYIKHFLLALIVVNLFCIDDDLHTLMKTRTQLSCVRAQSAEQGASGNHTTDYVNPIPDPPFTKGQ